MSLERENASEELAHTASKMRMKLESAADDDAVRRLSRKLLISCDRCSSSHTLMKSMDISNIPRTCVSTMRIGTEDMKKKYAICAANPA